MSAFVCNNYHISALAHYAATQELRYRHNNKTKVATDAAIIGLILHKENVRSFNYRYNATTPTTDFTFDPTVKARSFHASEIIAAVDCLEYQSCERPDWEKSEAKAILTTILAKAADEFRARAIWELRP
jgi:hypothetical protein